VLLLGLSKVAAEARHDHRCLGVCWSGPKKPSKSNVTPSSAVQTAGDKEPNGSHRPVSRPAPELIRTSKYNFEVTGAGTEEANGVYRRTGTIGRRPMYENPDKKYSISYDDSYISTDRRWTLKHQLGDNDVTLYFVMSRAMLPPAEDWKCNGNVPGPAPTLDLLYCGQEREFAMRKILRNQVPELPLMHMLHWFDDSVPQIPINSRGYRFCLGDRVRIDHPRKFTNEPGTLTEWNRKGLQRFRVLLDDGTHIYAFPQHLKRMPPTKDRNTRRRLTSDATGYGTPPTDGCGPRKEVWSHDYAATRRHIRRLMASEAAAGSAC